MSRRHDADNGYGLFAIPPVPMVERRNEATSMVGSHLNELRHTHERPDRCLFALCSVCSIPVDPRSQVLDYSLETCVGGYNIHDRTVIMVCCSI